ncbi:hypothetical protein SPSYN_02578 [Sporotomaculum syntrophicum]|uniref:Uncharacterized protein n=1 Tax=Sporotomaculum syntrophicum TaxID=182264 RepID=A0A9D2WMU4_9FIRM|nr:ABC transporter substrate-binding (seleno)protein SaoB [Sporotomaculum syntrophicum]KAF1084174.1 hypothetical protein SPSYN_02578 [Sporotomaculum syntrophicum]
MESQSLSTGGEKGLNLKMRNYLVLAAVLGLLLMAGNVTLPQPEKDNRLVKIGTPDDTGGLIIHYLVNTKGYAGAMVQQDFTMYPVKDCCASTAQWGLSTNLYDLAIMCPDAAVSLIAKDNRFEIVSPSLVNSDIVVIKSGQAPKKIGVAQNRNHQVKIVADHFAGDCATVPMLPSAIPYAYVKNVVDGVVVDALKGLTMQGTKLPATTNESEEHVTYVLVVNKSFKPDPRYHKFLRLFAESAVELNQPEILATAISNYKNIDFGHEEVNQWNRLRIKHVFTTPGIRG